MNSSGPEGFIYISFGSAAKASSMSMELRQIFFESMSKFQTSFVIKWDGEVPKDFPANVFPASWLPQQRVLGKNKLPNL